MRVVIIGNGKIGGSLSLLLEKEGHDVTVIDKKPEALKRSQFMQDIMCIEGDGALADIQREADVDKSDIVIACTPYDELNIMCCLIAKRLGAGKTISRVRMPDYFSQMHLISEELRLSMIINPELTTAQELSRVLIFPEAAKVEVFEKGRLELIEHKLPPDSVVAGKSLAEIYKQYKVNSLICAVSRTIDSRTGETEVYIPSGNFVLKAGDRISITASHDNLQKFFRKTGVMAGKVKNVMIIGGGRICYYLSNLLINVGMHVKIIEKDMARCQLLAQKLPKASIINGDGTDQDLLAEEHLSECDSFLALTGMDEENIIMSLYAQNNSDAKVICKVNRDNYALLAGDLGLDNIISPKELATSTVLSYVRSLENTSDNNIESLYHIVNNNVEAIEFRIRENIPGLVGVPLKDVRLKKNILIGAIIRKRKVIIPGGNDSIEYGDNVVVISRVASDDYRFTDIGKILA